VVVAAVHLSIMIRLALLIGIIVVAVLIYQGIGGSSGVVNAVQKSAENYGETSHMTDAARAAAELYYGQMNNASAGSVFQWQK